MVGGPGVAMTSASRQALAATPRIFGNSWWAWAFIVGPALPTEHVAIKPTRDYVKLTELGPLPRPEWRHEPRLRPFVRGIRSGTQTFPAQLWVHSDHVVRWEYRADDIVDATRKLENELAPDLLMALALLDVEPYRLEVLQVGRTSIDRRFEEPHAPWAFCQISKTHFAPMNSETFDALKFNLELLRRTPVVEKACRYFHDGVHALAFAQDERTLGAAALIRFHLAIETVLSEIPRPSRTDDEREAAYAPIVDGLSTRLADARSSRQAVAAIRQATKDFDDADHASYRARLADARQRLGLSEGTEALLLEFYRFRNDYLGHPNEHLDRELSIRWLREAHELAWTVVRAFVVHFGGTAVDLDSDRPLPLGPDEPVTFEVGQIKS